MAKKKKVPSVSLGYGDVLRKSKSSDIVKKLAKVRGHLSSKKG